MVFGRIAGKTALKKTDKKRVLPQNIPAISNVESDVDLAPMRERLSSVMRDSLNVVRDKDGLERGIDSVREMLSAIGDFEGCFDKHRLYNDLLTAHITLTSALERTSNVGCHCRADSIEETNKYRIEIKKNGEGMDVHRKSI
jgi:aspartate oxidase